MQTEVPQAYSCAQCRRPLLLSNAQHIAMHRLAVQDNNYRYNDKDDKNGDESDTPGEHFLPARSPALRTARNFARPVWRAIIWRKLRSCAQNACPMVTKYCVDLIPGGAFKLWPISKRIGPTGVA